MDLANVVSDCDFVFHLAGQPGVRSSWGTEFTVYVEDNIRATQHLLEACRGTDVRRFVFASSSSIYGSTETFPTHEDDATQPHSPYGVTKLAAEHLCSLYAAELGHADVVAALLHRLRAAAAPRHGDGAPHQLRPQRRAVRASYGDGTAIRDFTFVDDVVRANLLAAEAELDAGDRAQHRRRRRVLAARRDQDRRGRRGPAGQPRTPCRVARRRAKTGADISRAAKLIGWKPESTLEAGIEQQASWQLRTPPAGEPAPRNPAGRRVRWRRGTGWAIRRRAPLCADCPHQFVGGAARSRCVQRVVVRMVRAKPKLYESSSLVRVYNPKEGRRFVGATTSVSTPRAKSTSRCCTPRRPTSCRSSRLRSATMPRRSSRTASRR